MNPSLIGVRIVRRFCAITFTQAREPTQKGKAYQNSERHDAVLRPLLSKGGVSQFGVVRTKDWGNVRNRTKGLWRLAPKHIRISTEGTAER